MLICLEQSSGIACGYQNRNNARVCAGCGRPLRHVLRLLDKGEVVNRRYRILEVIGHGGFGAVYEAEDLQRGRLHIALKESFDADEIEHFQAEFDVLSNLSHVSLPSYYDVFTADGNGYLVMEYVPGQNLEEVVNSRRGPLPEQDVLDYACQLCNALTYLHSQRKRIIHRDIKPANVRITPRNLAILVDFGLVKQGAGPTQRSRRLGSPAYAPPEQWGTMGMHTGPRSDIYSLGATLYHVLSGAAPSVPGLDRLFAIQENGTDPLPPLRQCNPQISRVVADAVAAAMAVDPNQRPATAEAFWRLLARRAAPRSTTPRPAASQQTPALPSSARSCKGKTHPPRFALRAAAAWSLNIAAVRRIIDATLALSLMFAVCLFLVAILTVPSRGVEPPELPTAADQGTNPAPAPTIALPPAVNVTSTVTWTEPFSGLAFVRVPAGAFIMGSSDAQARAAQERCNVQALGCEGEDHAAETPRHSVAVGEYWIGLTEVTNAQFRAFVEGGGYNNSAWWTDAGWQWHSVNGIMQPGCWDDPALNQPNQPVVCVGWHEAAAYTRWLSNATQLEFRLPAEAEWEKAACDADGRTYPWGEEPVSGLRANFCDAQCAHSRRDGSVDDGFAGPAPVGSFPFGAGPYGALDMAGNVFEWTASEYRAYPVVNGDGRDGVGGDAARTLRGGSYYHTAGHTRCTQRIGVNPDTRNDLIGFRVASGGP